MPTFICTTCGTQFANTDQPPVECKICTDERQYVGWQGQQWTTLDDLRQSHRNVVKLEELGLYGIGMEPTFADERFTTNIAESALIESGMRRSARRDTRDKVAAAVMLQGFLDMMGRENGLS